MPVTHPVRKGRKSWANIYPLWVAQRFSPPRPDYLMAHRIRGSPPGMTQPRKASKLSGIDARITGGYFQNYRCREPGSRPEVGELARQVQGRVKLENYGKNKFLSGDQ